MAKQGKGKAVNAMCVFAFEVAKKMCADKGVDLTPPSEYKREVTLEAFLEYCENCEKMESLAKMLANYVTAPYKHEYEKAREKSEDKRKIARELAEAYAAEINL